MRLVAQEVEYMVRQTCGSCVRVRQEIEPVVLAAGIPFIVQDVDADPELAMAYGDRVPVVLIDGEEFACWECDPEELAHALL